MKEYLFTTTRRRHVDAQQARIDQTDTSDMSGLTENAGHEIDGPIFASFARHEIAGQNI